MCKPTEDSVRKAMQRMLACANTPEQLPLLEDIDLLLAFRKAHQNHHLPKDFCRNSTDVVTLFKNAGYILERNGINLHRDT